MKSFLKTNQGHYAGHFCVAGAETGKRIENSC